MTNCARGKAGGADSCTTTKSDDDSKDASAWQDALSKETQAAVSRAATASIVDATVARGDTNDQAIIILLLLLLLKSNIIILRLEFPSASFLAERKQRIFPT